MHAPKSGPPAGFHRRALLSLQPQPPHCSHWLKDDALCWTSGGSPRCTHPALPCLRALAHAAPFSKESPLLSPSDAQTARFVLSLQLRSLLPAPPLLQGDIGTLSCRVLPHLLRLARTDPPTPSQTGCLLPHPGMGFSCGPLLFQCQPWLWIKAPGFLNPWLEAPSSHPPADPSLEQQLAGW